MILHVNVPVCMSYVHTNNKSVCSSYHPITRMVAVIECETEAKPRSSNSIRLPSE